MSETSTPAPGQGDKYKAVELLLGEPPSDWIRKRRKAQQPAPSYSEVAEELNGVIKEAGVTGLRVTHESIRRWDPDGAYLAGLREASA